MQLPRVIHFRSAKADSGGANRTRNSANLAAGSESVLREFLGSRKEDALPQATLETNPLSAQELPPVELEQIFHDHRTRVFRAAYRITGNVNDAEDVLQTVFLRLARRDDPGGVQNLESYLYRAAINAAVDLLRSRKHTASAPLDETAPPDSPFSSALNHSQDLRVWLRQALAKLNARHAEMFALRYLEGYDNREIAHMLGTSQAVVAVTLHRTRGQLRKEFHSFAKRIN